MVARAAWTRKSKRNFLHLAPPAPIRQNRKRLRRKKPVQTRAKCQLDAEKMKPISNAGAPEKTTGSFYAWWKSLVFLLTAACLLSTLLAQAGRRAHPSPDAS